MLMQILLIAHLIIIACFFYAKKKGKIYLNFLLTMVLIFLPFLGALAVFYISKERTVRQGLPSPTFEQVFPWLSDREEAKEINLSQPIVIDDIENVVPFEEALLFNNSGIRRELIIDVIFEKPDQFVPLLHQARLNDDVEVVHYATTILSELTTKYDGQLYAFKNNLVENPDSVQNKLAYAHFLQDYIDSGIAEGHYAQSLKQDYIDLLQTFTLGELSLEKRLLVKLVKLYIEKKDFLSLERFLELLLIMFPDDEDIWILKLEEIISRKSSQDLKKYLQEIKKKQIYFSAKNQKVLAFWQ